MNRSNSISTFDEAKNGAIEHLKQFTQPGSNEAAYALDRSTGQVLDFAEGSASSVELNEEELSRSFDIAVLHSHPSNLPPSPQDWQTLVEQVTHRELTVVAPGQIYTLVKPPGWISAGQWQFSPFEDCENHVVNILVENGFAVGNAPSFRQWHDILFEANTRMARQYGIDFTSEVWDENSVHSH